MQTAPYPTSEQGRETQYLSAQQVKRRYAGCSDMTLWRWLRDPEMGFPKPVYVGRRRFWALSDLENFEAECAARGRRQNEAA